MSNMLAFSSKLIQMIAIRALFEFENTIFAEHILKQEKEECDGIANATKPAFQGFETVFLNSSTS